MSASRSQNRYVALAVEMINRHQWAKAIDTLLYAQTLNASPIDICFHLALAYLGSENLELAEQHAREVLRMNPREPNAHLNLGAIKEKQGNLKEAVRHYNLELKFRSSCLEAHFNLGTIFFERHQWTRSFRHLKLCFDAKHNGSNLCYMVGFCAWKTGDAATEQLVYREAFAANPKDVWAINNLAAVLIDQGKFAQARGLLNRANALTPDDPAIFRNISKCTQMKLTRPANRAPTRPGSMQGQAASAESADS